MNLLGLRARLRLRTTAGVRAPVALASSLAALLALGACGGNRANERTATGGGGSVAGKEGSARASGSKGDGKGGGKGQATPRPVHTIAAERSELPRIVRVTGTLAAEDQVVLGTKVAGRVTEVPVDLGSRVTRGQVLAKLAPVDFQLRVRQSEAALQQARSRLGLEKGAREDELAAEGTALVKQAAAVLQEARVRRDRARSLFGEQLLPRSELDSAEASYQVAEAGYQDAVEEVRNREAIVGQRRSELDLAHQQLMDSVLRAPFDGAVRERHASPGQYVAAGQPIVTLVRVHPLRLRLQVPERDSAGVREGQEVRLTVEGDARPHSGRIVRLSPAIEESNRTLLVEAEVQNPDGSLRPGSFASASVVTAAGDAVVLVPASAIVSFAGVERLIVVKDGKAVERRVRTGRREQGQVEVQEGVDPGESVVVDPGNLVQGDLVTVAS